MVGACTGRSVRRSRSLACLSADRRIFEATTIKRVKISSVVARGVADRHGVAIEPTLASMNVNGSNNGEALVTSIRKGVLTLINNVVRRAHVGVAMVARRRALVRVLFVRFPLDSSAKGHDLRANYGRVTRTRLEDGLYLTNVLFHSRRLVVVVVEYGNSKRLRSGVPTALIVLDLQQYVNAWRNRIRLVTRVAREVEGSLRVALRHSTRCLRTGFRRCNGELRRGTRQDVNVARRYYQAGALVDHLLQVVGE